MKPPLLPLLLFWVLIFIGLNAAIAQSNPNSLGIIMGKLQDEETGQPIPFAVVSLMEKNTDQTIRTIQSDESGNFKFIGVKFGSYKIKSSMIGFGPIIIEDVVLNSNQYERNLGLLKMSAETSALSEIVITAPKPLLEFGADQITYNVSESILAEGSTATDILKNVPMVQVDIDGNPTIAGKRSTRIFIDGKPSEYLSANIADLLNVLPSDAIEKIEVLTNPPARYSGDGEGILNIVLKKGFKVGFNGNIGSTIGTQGNYNNNVNASYKGQKFSINGGAAFRHSITKNSSENYRTNLFPDTTFYYNQFNNGKNIGNGGNARIGMEWDINPKHNIRVTSNYNLNRGNNQSNNDFHYINDQYNTVRLRHQLNLGNTRNRNFVFNVDYRVKTDSEGGKFNLSLSYNNNHLSNERSLDRYFAFPVNLNPSLQQNESEVFNRGLSLNADYDKPVFNKRDLIELGFSFNNRQNDNHQEVFNFDFQNQKFVPNVALSNQFVYIENLMAAYGSYTYKSNGWSVKTGLRSELTNVNMELSNNAIVPINPYVSFFPSVSINRHFNKRYHIGTSFSIRINRPRENTLNPQINNADTLNIFYGNPNLNPAFTQQIGLSFGVFGDNWSFNPRLSYSRSSGVIERFRRVLPTGVSESTFENVGNNSALTLLLNGNYKPSNKISLNGNFNIFRTQYQSSLNTALNRNGIGMRSNLGISLQLPQKIAVESQLNYANTPNAQGRNRGFLNSSFGARKTFSKNKLMLRLSTTDPFGKSKTSSINEGLNFYAENYAYTNSQNFLLTLNYRFSNIKSTKPTIPPPSAK
ncbi:MAG: TonB-dependent receptor [Pedobacter sp.]|nr:MAG: TonB-dependent receptor [Pedobacter sp.]